MWSFQSFGRGTTALLKLSAKFVLDQHRRQLAFELDNAQMKGVVLLRSLSMLVGGKWSIFLRHRFT